MAGKEAKISHRGEESGSLNDSAEATGLVQRLVAEGASRLTAERIAAIERGDAEPGRARRHPQSRR
jgi:hypothetical protein